MSVIFQTFAAGKEIRVLKDPICSQPDREQVDFDALQRATICQRRQRQGES